MNFPIQKNQKKLEKKIKKNAALFNRRYNYNRRDIL